MIEQGATSSEASPWIRLPLDAFFSLISGASRDVVVQNLSLSDEVLAHISTQLDVLSQRRTQTLYSRDDPSGRFLLEILQIKINTILLLLKASKSALQSSQEPRLDLCSSNVTISIPLSNPFPPSFWSISLDVLGADTVSPDADPACDAQGCQMIQSVGKMMLSGLLINDWNTVGELQAEISQIVSALDAEKRQGEIDLEGMQTVVQEEVSNAKSFFSADHLLYQGDLGPTKNNLPGDIWEKVLLLAFDMLYFSESRWADIEPEHQNASTAVLIDHYSLMIEDLLRVIQVQLFDQEMQDKTILGVLDTSLSEI